MDPADLLVMDNPYVKEADDETLSSIIQSSGDTNTLSSIIQSSGDTNTLSSIIQSSGDTNTLSSIIQSSGDTNTLSSIIQSSGDTNTLSSIIQSSGDAKALQLLNSGQTFSQDELDMALISACRCGYEPLVCELVNFGANVQTKDRNANTPLLICAENGFISIAKFLFGRKVDINTANNLGDTALMLAIHPQGSVEMVKLLLAQTGINVNHQNGEGYTALMKAITVLNIDVIKLLLDSQKNTAEVLDGIKNCRNETPQELADKLGIGKVVKLLSKPHGAKVPNPFLAAVLACDVDSLDILLDCPFYQSLHRKSIIQSCFKKVFAVHEKSGKNFSADEEKIVQRLLECGADVHEFTNSKLLLIAIKAGSYKVVSDLMRDLTGDRKIG